MGDSPYKSRCNSARHLVGTHPTQWRTWLLCVPVSVFLAILMLDGVALWSGFSFENGDRSRLESIVLYLNLPGFILVLFFGDLLSRPDDPIREWHTPLYLVGSIAFWAILTALVTLLLYLKRRASLSQKVTPSRA